MDCTFETTGGFFTAAVKQLLEQLESLLENGIIDLLDLETYRNVIFDQNNTDEEVDCINVSATQLFGLGVIEIWFNIKKSTNALFEDGVSLPNLVNLFNNLVTVITDGIKCALEKYHDAFNVYITGKVSDVLSALHLALDDVNNQAGQDLRKAISASLNIILDLNNDIITRLRNAGLALITGVIGIIKVDTVCANLYELFIKLMKIVQDSESILDSIINKVTQRDIEYFQSQKALVDAYNAELLKIDLDSFKNQTDAYRYVGERLSTAKNDDELNYRLKEIMHGLGIKLSWEKTHESFDAFMRDKNARMIFE